jgi:heat shock protein HslJ
MRRTCTTLALALTLTACASASGGGSAVLEGTTWRIVQVDGQNVDAPTNVDLAPHLRVLSAEGRVHGAAGCNRFSGPYQADGTSVRFGPLVTTRMACADGGRQALEGRILDALQAADGYRIDGRHLWIMTGGQARLTLEVW